MKPARLLPLAAVVLALVVAAALIPLVRDDGPGPGEAIVTVHGQAKVTRAAGPVERLSGEALLRRADRIEILHGYAEFRLTDGVAYEGRAGGAGRLAGTTVRMGVVPTLLAGRLLVTAERSATVSSSGTRIVVRAGDDGSAARLVANLALAVGVYRGRASVDSAGVALAVPALRSVELPAPGEVPRHPLPLDYAAGDGWDRRYLGAAIGLDGEIQPLLAGFTSSGGDRMASADRLRKAMRPPPSRASLLQLVSGRRDAAGSLVGATIAGLERKGSFADRWREVFALRDQGARWGLVALDRKVDPSAVIDALGGALDASDFAFRQVSRQGSGELAGSSLAPGAVTGAGTGPSTATGVDGAGSTASGSSPGAAAGPAITGPGPTTSAPGAAGSGSTPSSSPGVANPAGRGSTSNGPPVTIPRPVTSVANSATGTAGRVTGGVTNAAGHVVGDVLAPVTGPGGVLAPVTGPGGVLAPVTGPGGVLAPVTGPGGVLAPVTRSNGSAPVTGTAGLSAPG